MPPTVFQAIEHDAQISLDAETEQTPKLLAIADERVRKVIDAVFTAMGEVVVPLGGITLTIEDTLPDGETLATLALAAGTYAAGTKWSWGQGRATIDEDVWKQGLHIKLNAPLHLCAHWAGGAGATGMIDCRLITQPADGGHK
jgi:hypothetical protein